MIATVAAPDNLAGYDPHEQADGFSYDHEAGEKAVQFFSRCLTFVKGARAGRALYTVAVAGRDCTHHLRLEKAGWE